MEEPSINTIDEAGNREDYAGACCLLVREGGRRRHERVEVLIDADRLDELGRFDWMLQRKRYARKNRYVVCRAPLPGMQGWSLNLHRYLMNPPQDMVVDHINRVPEDNRLMNLRVCTHFQNNKNTGPRKTKKKSKFKGVYRRQSYWSPWFAKITVDGKQKTIGSFSTELQAAHAYNVAIKELHGEYAYLNPLPPGYDPSKDRRKKPGPKIEVKPAPVNPVFRLGILVSCDPEG